MLIHVIELRDKDGSNLCFLGSSFESCEKFMFDNTDFTGYDEGHWAYYTQTLDQNGSDDENNLAYFSMGMEELDYQPQYK